MPSRRIDPKQTRHPKDPLRMYNPWFPRTEIRHSRALHEAISERALAALVTGCYPFTRRKTRAGAIHIKAGIGRTQIAFPNDPRLALHKTALEEKTGILALTNGEGVAYYVFGVFDQLITNRSIFSRQRLRDLSASGSFNPLAYVSARNYRDQVGGRQKASLAELFPEATRCETWGERKAGAGGQVAVWLRVLGRQVLVGGRPGSPFANDIKVRRLLFSWLYQAGELEIYELVPEGLRPDSMELCLRDVMRIDKRGNIRTETVAYRKPSGVIAVELYSCPFAETAAVSTDNVVPWKNMVFALKNPPQVSFLDREQGALTACVNFSRLDWAWTSREATHRWHLPFKPNGDIHDGVGRLVRVRVRDGELVPLNIHDFTAKRKAYANLWDVLAGTVPQWIEGKTHVDFCEIEAWLSKLARGEIKKLPREAYAVCAEVRVSDEASSDGSVAVSLDRGVGTPEVVHIVDRRFSQQDLIGKNVRCALEETAFGPALVFYYDRFEGRRVVIKDDHLFSPLFDAEEGLFNVLVRKEKEVWVHRYMIVSRDGQFEFSRREEAVVRREGKLVWLYTELTAEEKRIMRGSIEESGAPKRPAPPERKVTVADVRLSETREIEAAGYQISFLGLPHEDMRFGSVLVQETRSALIFTFTFDGESSSLLFRKNAAGKLIDGAGEVVSVPRGGIINLWDEISGMRVRGIEGKQVVSQDMIEKGLTQLKRGRRIGRTYFKRVAPVTVKRDRFGVAYVEFLVDGEPVRYVHDDFHIYDLIGKSVWVAFEPTKYAPSLTFYHAPSGPENAAEAEDIAKTFMSSHLGLLGELRHPAITNFSWYVCFMDRPNIRVDGEWYGIRLLQRVVGKTRAYRIGIQLDVHGIRRLVTAHAFVVNGDQLEEVHLPGLGVSSPARPSRSAARWSGDRVSAEEAAWVRPATFDREW